MSNRERLFRIYWKMEQRLVPGLRYSQLQYEDALRDAIGASTTWLDLGCGKRVLPSSRRAAEHDLVRQANGVVGADPSFEQLGQHESVTQKVVALGEDLPFASNHFDLVTANMVVEHFEFPETCFREIHRVLRPGGTFLFHTPNSDGYAPRLASWLPDRAKEWLVRTVEGRVAGDVFPAFYRANTPAIVSRLAVETNFQEGEIRTVLSSAHAATFPPLAFVELLWIRRLRRPELADKRPVLIVSLRKPGD